MLLLCLCSRTENSYKEGMTEEKETYANLLILLQNFENLWNMYSVSEGFLYYNEVKRSARVFLELFNKVSEAHPEIRSSKVLQINPIDSTELLDGLVMELHDWTESDRLFPCDSTETGMGNNETSRFALQPFFMCISAFIVGKLELSYRPVLCKSSGEGAFHKNNIKWNGRFPWEICDQVDDNFLKCLSENETVVIVGDVRKSQDLITYSVNPNTYRINMTSFIENIKKIVLDNMGIFDRFTGDGFICYFNSYLSQMFRRDLYKTVVDVCVKIQNESQPFFEKWQQNLRKISHDDIGLSIGIDVGKMDFSDDSMIFAIGTPAVWASRMCSAGNAGEILFNNIPHAQICNVESTYSFEEVLGTTKAGEQFKAFNLRYDTGITA